MASMRIRVPDGEPNQCGSMRREPQKEYRYQYPSKKMVGQRRKGKDRIGRILGLTDKGERFGKVEEVRRRKETSKDDINDKRKGKSTSVRHYLRHKLGTVYYGGHCRLHTERRNGRYLCN